VASAVHSVFSGADEQTDSVECIIPAPSTNPGSEAKLSDGVSGATLCMMRNPEPMSFTMADGASYDT
jgi:hypothetical protein